ncbi:ATP-binding protein [Streptomyces sp. NPDC060194]|uniref:ATP-binding protein n=1 Tax=Streptomyces sp. NPDC060194 TaxID=3347069 RepID=UPI00364C5AAB
MNVDPPSAPLLRVCLLGGFRVSRDGGPEVAARWPRPNARALVKLLAVTPGHRLHREQVMEACWPDAEPRAAAGRLRVALHAARHALEPELPPRAASSYLVSDGAFLFLDPAVVRVDVDEAEAAAEAALVTGDRDELGLSVRELRGELLPDDRYVSWVEDRRAGLVLLRERVRLRLAAAHLDHGAPREAAAVAEQILEGSPAEERAHRILLDAALRQGRRREAVRAYHRCREALAAELGVAPGPETERLHRLALAAGPAAAPAPVLPAPLRTRPATPLRGRDAELGRLLGSGGPPVVLLTGEAGVGKTRLAGEAARRAAAEGAAVLWGGARDAEGRTPYGAFAEALDGWLAEHDAAERGRVGGEYPELAAFLPSLGQARAGGGRSPEEERDRLFRASTALLGDLAAARPVRIVLDDLHAADAGSFQLLGHLARRAAERRLPLRFLVTYRDEELPPDDPRRWSLTALVRQGLATEEPVARLGEQACLALARDALGRDPRSRAAQDPGPGGRAPAAGQAPSRGAAATDVPGPAGADRAGARVAPAAADGVEPAAAEARLRRVWRLSLGNPLFALELARADDASAGEAGAPTGVRQLVGERLVRLPPDARRLVEALAVAGGHAALGELLDVAERGLVPSLGPAAAADAVEDAIGASLIEERRIVAAGRSEDGLAFRHPLVRLTCYEQLTTARRRQLHGAFGRAVLRRRPDAVDTLALHFARADDPSAADHLRRAAERAATLYANDAADRYYRELVARLDVDAARARLAHGQVLARMGRFAQAADVLRPALAEFARRGERDAGVLAAARLADALVKAGAPDAADDVLRRHPARGTDAPAPLTAHHLALSAIRWFQGRYDDGHAAAGRALAAARRVPEAAGQSLVARAHVLQATNLGLAGRFGPACAAADRALAPAEASGDPTLLGSVLSTLRENARRAGRLHEAQEIGRRALDLAERSGAVTSAAFERANLAELWLLLGDPETARGYAEAAVEGADWEGASSLPYTLAALARVRWEAGERTAAVTALDRAEACAAARGDRQADDVVSRVRAEFALLDGDAETALRALDAAALGAPVLTAWAELLAGRTESARLLAAAEAARAARTGERLAEADAGVVHAAALARLGATADADRTLSRAEELCRALPYPAGTRRVARARERLHEGWAGR